MCAEMFGYAVSEATIQSARQEQHEALEPFEERLSQFSPRNLFCTPTKRAFRSIRSNIGCMSLHAPADVFRNPLGPRQRGDRSHGDHP